MENAKSIKIDLLVTTYKRLEDLNLLIRNLEDQVYTNFQLQVFDGTPDDTVKTLIENYKNSDRKLNYKIIYHYTGCGMTKQRNIAVDKTRGDISIFLDDDVILEDNYLEEVAKVFDYDKSGSIAGLNGYDTKCSGKIGMRQKILRFFGLFPKMGNARYLDWGHGTPHYEGDYFQGVRECDLLIGFNMAFRTKILKQFRFDKFFEQYPTYVLYDDTDICLRIKKAGYKIVQAGNARLQHNISPFGRPPAEHYGFQTTFNAYRNWRTHIISPNKKTKIKFWSFEILNIILIGFSNLIKNQSLDEVYGRMRGIQAIYHGHKDYNSWLNK